MKSIFTYIDFTLTLEQSSVWKSSYEIRFGDVLLGKIDIPKLLSDRAKVHSADGDWYFNRKSIFKRDAFAYNNDNNIVASFQPHCFRQKGKLLVGDNLDLKVEFKIFRNTMDIISLYDEPLIHFDNSGVVKFKSEINIFRTAKHLPQLPLIFYFSCYILLLKRRDASRSASV